MKAIMTTSLTRGVPAVSTAKACMSLFCATETTAIGPIPG